MIDRASGVAGWSVAQLGEFYAQNRSEFFDHASRILRNSERADEVTQDALVKVLLASPELETQEHASAYMHRTIENICIDIFRNEGRRPNLVSLDEDSSEAERKWQISGDHCEVISMAEDAAIVRNALSLLSGSERAALVMWELEGRSAKEISRELGIKESSVKHTVSRARKALRKILSEIVIDEARGLTALDALSKSYRRATDIAQKSSKIALSLILVFIAFIGFNSIPGLQGNQSEIEEVVDSVNVASGVSNSSLNGSNGVEIGVVEQTDSPSPVLGKVSRVENMRSAEVFFQGLDKSGDPIGFTIADSTGGFGNAYFKERTPLFSETELTVGQILKTESGASNIFISQSITTDSSGLIYRPNVAFGQDGRWVPLQVRVASTDIMRQSSGNYLLTAYVAVDSAIDSPIQIVASARGRDLAVAPRQIITRMMLDPTKTQVLKQAIYVVERGAKF